MLKYISSAGLLPTDPNKKYIVNHSKSITSNLIISNKSSPSTKLLDRTNVVFMFKCPLDTVSPTKIFGRLVLPLQVFRAVYYTP